jgi:hypothetical protein
MTFSADPGIGPTPGRAVVHAVATSVPPFAGGAKVSTTVIAFGRRSR